MKIKISFICLFVFLLTSSAFADKGWWTLPSTGGGSGDMTKAVYDVADNGSVDTCDALAANPAAATAGSCITDIAADGSVEGEVDVWTEAENTAAAYLQNMVEDLTPQLAGGLDAQGNEITNLGDVTFKTGAAGGTLRTGTSAADKYELQAYDVDGGVYTKVMEADANNDPTLEVFDETFSVRDSADETKIWRWQLGGLTTANTRTFTPPDVDLTISSFAATFLDDADEATLKATLNMEAGTDYADATSDITAVGDCASGACTMDAALDNEDISPTGGTWDLSALTLLTLPTFKNGATSAGFIKIQEDSDNGTNVLSVYAPAAIGSDYSLTFPEDSGGILQTEDTTATFTNKTLAAGSNTITLTDSAFLPVEWAEDGSSPPAAAAAVTGTTRHVGRAFDGASNEDVTFVWEVPEDFSGSTVTASVTGVVSNATAPANTEVVAFSVALACYGNSEASTTAVGTAQTTSVTADATYVQYDRLKTTASSAITPAGSIAAGETCAIALTRLATTTDTYAQDFDVIGMTLNFGRTLE